MLYSLVTEKRRKTNYQPTTMWGLLLTKYYESYDNYYQTLHHNNNRN
jgi:hypothetical protein